MAARADIGRQQWVRQTHSCFAKDAVFGAEDGAYPT